MNTESRYIDPNDDRLDGYRDAWPESMMKAVTKQVPAESSQHIRVDINPKDIKKGDCSIDHNGKIDKATGLFRDRNGFKIKLTNPATHIGLPTIGSSYVDLYEFIHSKRLGNEKTLTFGFEKVTKNNTKSK